MTCRTIAAYAISALLGGTGVALAQPDVQSRVSTPSDEQIPHDGSASTAPQIPGERASTGASRSSAPIAAANSGAVPESQWFNQSGP